MLRVLNLVSFGLLAGGPVLGVATVALAVTLAARGAWGPAAVTAPSGLVLGLLLHFLGLGGLFTEHTGSRGRRRLRAAGVRPALTPGLAAALGTGVTMTAGALTVAVAGTVRAFALGVAAEPWAAAWTVLGILGGAAVLFAVGLCVCSHVSEALDERATQAEQAPGRP
ncbi:MAG TPA: hypothetical protein VNV66_16775 [Pilimelia sp.]|nr:hypothetical protein [Pilimelia sp.]